MNWVLADLLQEQAPDFLESSVLLVFSPADPDAITTSQPGRSQVTFRKKPPSQVRIDRKRAVDKQKARADQKSVYILLIARCLYLCQHHLPKEMTLTVGMLENNSLTVHKLSVRSAREIRENEADGCLLQLPEPDPEPDPEAKIPSYGIQHRRATRLRQSAGRTPGQKSAHQQICLHQFSQQTVPRVWLTI